MHLKTTLLLALALTGSNIDAQGESQPPSTKKDKQDKPAPKHWSGVLSEKEFAALHELKSGASPILYGRDIRIDGTKAYLTLPKSGKAKAAVLVIHEWWGLNDNVKHWSDRLAADGYAALAVDLYGGVVATTREAASQAMGSVNKEEAAATLKAAYAFLADDPRVKAEKRACIGWCFGGGWSLRFAMATPDLDAAVIYYGHLVNDATQLSRIGAPILGVFGNKDRGIPPATVDEFAAAMKKAGRSLELHRYDANHAFANPSSARYDGENASAAWKEVRRFLQEKLGDSADEQTGSFALGGRKVQHTIPKDWTAGPPHQMRVITYDISESTECYVTVLKGHGGGIGPNINRWRAQLKQPRLTAEELAELPRAKILGVESVLVRIDGDLPSGGSGTMLGAVCTLDSQTLFVKMTGPAKEMKDQEKNFKAFCTSFR